MKIKRCLFISLGLLATFLGFAGVFIPLLPTTPFLLLAAILFLNSSERLYSWLINNKLVGRYVYGYLKYKAVTRKIKIGTLVTLWLALTVSMLLLKSVYLSLFLVIVGIGVSIHVILLKTLKKEKLKYPQDSDDSIS